jgi:ketosteroid isomerase-like protein
MNDKEQIENVIGAFETAFRSGDMHSMSSLWSHSDDAVFIGSAAHEFYKGWRSVEMGLGIILADTARIKSKVYYRIRDINILNNTAWVIMTTEGSYLTEDAEKIHAVRRITSVLCREGDEWKICMWHGSTSNPAILPGTSYPSIGGIVNAIEEWLRGFKISGHDMDLSEEAKILEYLQLVRSVISQMG